MCFPPSKFHLDDNFSRQIRPRSDWQKNTKTMSRIHFFHEIAPAQRISQKINLHFKILGNAGVFFQIIHASRQKGPDPRKHLTHQKSLLQCIISSKRISLPPLFRLQPQASLQSKSPFQVRYRHTKNSRTPETSASRIKTSKNQASIRLEPSPSLCPRFFLQQTDGRTEAFEKK